MGKIKDKNKKRNTIEKNIVSRGGSCPQFPAFSFIYITTNRRYNLNFFKNEKKRHFMAEKIYDRLLNICQSEWKHWMLLSKEQGIETLSAYRLNFSPAKRTLTPDEKVFVFRMKGSNGQSHRIIGIREDNCPIYFISGYDFDFSAYDHGA